MDDRGVGGSGPLHTGPRPARVDGVLDARRTFEAARSIDLAVGGSPSRANCWRVVARQRSLAGDAGGALRWAADETDPSLRYSILIGVASGLIERRAEAPDTERME